jgi:hypothetical protein
MARNGVGITLADFANGMISKQGDRYLRGLFIAGALAVIRYAKIHGVLLRGRHARRRLASIVHRGPKSLRHEPIPQEQPVVGAVGAVRRKSPLHKTRPHAR